MPDIPSWISTPVIFILTVMFQWSNSRWCQRWIGLLMILVPIGFFLLFGMMEDRMMPREFQIIQPTPLSMIALYPSRVPLINLRHFKYVINNDICAKRNIFSVLLIHSHPANRDLRDAMRKNTPQEDLNDIGIKRVFLMARAEWNDQALYRKTPQYEINEENVLHSDIVQGNFKEHYHNLTYKHVMGLQWAGKYCPQAKYIIKMDDDIIVDIFQFRDLLKKRYEYRSKLILGLLQIEAKPVRNPESKWYVSEKEYAKSSYSNFVSGWAYAMTNDAAASIVELANRTPYFWIDDVHVTGTLAEETGVHREGLNRFYTLHQDYLKCCVTLPSHGDYFCDFMVGPSENNVQVMEDVLKHARECYSRLCKRRPLELRLTKTCVTSVVHPLSPAGRGTGEVIKL